MSELAARTLDHGLWANINNAKFYENLSARHFEEVVDLIGLTNCQDIRLILPYLLKCKRVLEVGSAYGRVLKYLLSKGYEGEFIAVERSRNLYKTFCQRFKKSKKITAINQDIANVHFKNSLDAVIWPWCGISDFGPQEQQNVLAKLKLMLKNNGYLIVETSSINIIPINSNYSDKHYFHFEVEKNELFSYIPENKEILEYTKFLGLYLEKKICYTTQKNRNRIIYILKKSVFN